VDCYSNLENSCCQENIGSEHGEVKEPAGYHYERNSDEGKRCGEELMTNNGRWFELGHARERWDGKTDQFITHGS